MANLLYALPIYLGPHNRVYKLGVANAGNPVFSNPLVVTQNSNTSLAIPVGFVDTSRGNSPKIYALELYLTPIIDTNFFTYKLRITSLTQDTITLTRDADASGIETLIARLHMQIPHSIIGLLPGEAI